MRLTSAMVVSALVLGSGGIPAEGMSPDETDARIPSSGPTVVAPCSVLAEERFASFLEIVARHYTEYGVIVAVCCPTRDDSLRTALSHGCRPYLATECPREIRLLGRMEELNRSYDLERFIPQHLLQDLDLVIDGEHARRSHLEQVQITLQTSRIRAGQGPDAAGGGRITLESLLRQRGLGAVFIPAVPGQCDRAWITLLQRILSDHPHRCIVASELIADEVGDRLGWSRSLIELESSPALLLLP